MSLFSRLIVTTKATLQLGPGQMSQYALYQLSLRSGHYQRELNKTLKQLERLEHDLHLEIKPALPSLPDLHTLTDLIGPQLADLYEEADEITSGFVRLFGGHPIPLELTPPKPLMNWSKYEGRVYQAGDRDIKFTWEMGRFGWACKLAMAYHLSRDEHYAATFWEYTERFINYNPPYLGPHWSSAQEVAIRLVCLSFVSQVIGSSVHTTPERLEMLKKTLAAHAERIPPTLAYARSQNNNHLITESLGLYTASAVLPGHPLAARWHALGLKWLEHAFLSQISADGTYAQHSTNYHRLMLQSALWAFAVHDHAFPNEPIQSEVKTRLAAATRWLWKLVDPDSGHIPNLGHNDGAYILPLTVCPYPDFRPVLYAASRAFLNTQISPHGAWEDMSLWLTGSLAGEYVEAGLDYEHKAQPGDEPNPRPPYTVVNSCPDSWATLRVARFHSRPAHADQLHLDLWWRGLNLAQDPGTYSYNAAPPWENALTSAFVHNTVTVDGQEFMHRAGRFLYLDWAQAMLLTHQLAKDGGWESLSAQHDGYRQLGVTHTRTVTALADNRWEVIDLLDGNVGSVHTARLHWLLPDWEYALLGTSGDPITQLFGIRIQSPHGWLEVKVSSPSARSKDSPSEINAMLARAGALLDGSGKVSPITGWTSPTYGDKIPALALIVEISRPLPIELKTEWILPSAS